MEGKEESCVYKNPDAPVEARVQDLLSRMTLLEKIGQMTQIERAVTTHAGITDFFIGSVLNGGGSWPFEDAMSSDWADMIDGYQNAALATRLGIPIIYGIDAVHGNNNVYGATIFPHNIGLGATRDADLIKRIGAATALEVRASGAHWAFAPCVAALRDPRWGRSYECYSEDSNTICELTSLVSGLQGEPPKEHPNGYPFLAGRNNVVACAKHFVGDGGTENGTNEGNTIVSYEDLERIHVAPYLNCLAQGVSTVMASYSSWNGRKLHSDYFLLTELLKQKLGFKGFVISDWEALDRLSEPFGSNYRNCVKMSVNAGVDMVMVPFKYEPFIKDLKDLVESGEVPMARIDDAVERILRVKFVAGLFEHPLADRSLLPTVGCKEHRELGREAVRKSLVLLKNGNNVDKPIIYGTDAVHGNNNVYGATIFPHNIGLGATRDADLVRRIGAATALEVRASGVHWTFAPCVAVLGDPRWGRCYESYSEAANIVCEMSSLISGLQGEPPEEHPNGYPFLAGRNNLVACAKHFVGDGGTDKGLSEGNTIASYEELEKKHVAPYLNCIAQGVCTVMVSFSSWNGSRLHSDYFLLTQLLKQKLGFKGFLVSDWDGLETISEPQGSNYRDCVKLGISAGIDMVMVPFKYQQFIEDLTDLVESGEVPMARVDDAVERILRVKFVAGLFEHPLADRSLLPTVGCKEHRELAREAVRKSLVLLKNGRNSVKPFMPLDRMAEKILVVGSHANDLGNQCGGWTKTKSGLSGRITIGTTLLDAIKAAVGDKTEVIYEKTPSKETLASGEGFSYAIVAVGEPPYAEMKGDNSELTIPFNGSDIVTAVAEKIPTLVILFSGRPMVLEPPVLEKTEALVAAWFPGTEGQGVADVIFGDYEFQGKLPVSWFKHVEQLPLNADAKLYDPLFPLGFGLTSRSGLTSPV